MILSSRLDSEQYQAKLRDILSGAKNEHQLYERIVNAPFQDRHWTTLLGLGIVVLLLVNKKAGTIDRIALSDTDLAHSTVQISVKPFRAIKIPIGYKGNLIAEAIRSGRYQMTSDWQYLFAPALSPEESRLNQAGGGIGCSFIYPLKEAGDGGAMIFSYYVTPDKITDEHREFMYRYSRMAASKLSGR